MEPEAPEALEIPPPGDVLLVELRGERARAAEPFKTRWVQLTIDQASYLYEKLRRIAADPPKSRPRSVPWHGVADSQALLDLLSEKLFRLPPTTGEIQDELAPRSLTLEVSPFAAKFLLQILANRRRDEWRRQKVERALFEPLTKLEAAEKEDEKSAAPALRFGSGYPENPAAKLRSAVLAKALADLPRALKLPDDETETLLAALVQAGGNVSEAARKLGLPQRKTARLVARIARH
ncbi:MAG: hypothetical protein KGM24_02560, partial [Elusimicrobia bacterium]|nr:hypothetical protein [Elusimicrobiota bacterium]